MYLNSSYFLFEILSIGDYLKCVSIGTSPSLFLSITMLCIRTFFILDKYLVASANGYLYNSRLLRNHDNTKHVKLILPLIENRMFISDSPMSLNSPIFMQPIICKFSKLRILLTNKM